MDSLAGTLGCRLVQGTNPAQPMTLILKYKIFSCKPDKDI